MTGEDLRRIERELKFQPRHMCAEFGLPRRTYQDYRTGRRGIPRDLAERIRETHRRDREWVAGIGGRVDEIEEEQR